MRVRSSSLQTAKTTSTISKEGGCSMQQDLDGRKDWNNIQGLKFTV